MPNPLFQQLNPQNLQNPMPNSSNGFMNLVNQFNSFRNNFQGDPQQIVQGLLSSGRMTQDQFQKLSQMAREFQELLPK